MNELNTTIENLYLTFGKYTTEGIYYCDCGCVKEEDVRKLNSKPLRQLEEDDLVSYYGSALYTWGDVEHYKHYLPRICELISSNRNYAFVNVDEIFNKLEYAQWMEWPEEEQQAIKDYVMADWMDLVNNQTSEIGVSKLEEYGKFLGIAELIRAWDISGLRNFVYFFYYHGNTILNGGLKIDGKNYENEFLQFIKRNDLIEKLETTFFKNEKEDEDYAEKISVVLQIIEQELKLKG
ncbi:MAG: hypothetical protein ACKVQB_12445 [Bacteroidia bacterium]